MTDADNNFQEVVKVSDRWSPEIKAEIIRQTEKYSNMPPRYLAFTIKHKCFWIWLNVFNILTSGVMAAGSVMILSNDHD